VDLKEELEDLPKGDSGGIEDDFDRLGMRPVIPIRRLGRVAARVPDPGGDHAWIFPKEVLHAPEASAGQYCAFLGHDLSSTWLK
jgi:hypothetical protein